MTARGTKPGAGRAEAHAEAHDLAQAAPHARGTQEQGKRQEKHQQH